MTTLSIDPKIQKLQEIWNDKEHKKFGFYQLVDLVYPQSTMQAHVDGEQDGGSGSRRITRRQPQKLEKKNK
ncbi:MAG: hypothetical protein ACRDFB_08620 [Rhabdochlamydiaceae bacterium]